MKKIFILTPLIILLCLVGVYFLFPGVMFDLLKTAERSAAGLKQKSVQVNGLRIEYLKGGKIMIETFHKIIALRRSVRKFKPVPVDSEILAKLIDAARLGPSAANKQALVFIAVNNPSLAGQIFETQKFAAYLSGAGQPRPGEEPAAHILIARNKELAIAETIRDVGAAAQTILMGACAYGLGATWLRSFDRPRAARILNLPELYQPDSVIALGLPDESPEVVPIKDGDVKYWRDETGQHFVPKRPFEEVCFLNGYSKGWS